MPSFIAMTGHEYSAQANAGPKVATRMGGLCKRTVKDIDL